MIIFQICVLFVCVAAELHDQLQYFETLHHVDVKVRRKRNSDENKSASQDVSFAAFGKHFNMELWPGTSVVTADFQAKLIYGDGQSVPFYINKNRFFTGHLAENENVKVDALTEDDLWTANIYDVNEIYTIEPSWRHLPPSTNHSMIAYRHSDIKWNNIFPDLNQTSNTREFCHGIHPKDEAGNSSDWDQEREMKEMHAGKSSARVKRRTAEQNTCHIMAVADFTFFSGPGGGFPHRTANYLIQTMQKVNRLYRETVWDAEFGLTHLGLQIKELRIHMEITNASNYHRNGRHYNMYGGETSWPYGDLLEQFGEDENISKFCLAHLFTHRTFAGGVLGLAYIASPRKYAIGGICSTRRSTERNYNIGFSSTMNTKGHNLLTQEATLVTAHEFGHNWGAEHDAETAECAPDGFNNGRFIMYPFAVSGYDENNNKFSPCSKRYISAVLMTRSEICFKAQSSNVPLCGDGNIDNDEDCDGGGMGLSGQDPCCSASCKFIGNASCSSTNFECCKNCRLAPANMPCRGASPELCQEAAVCTGRNLTCPLSVPLRDNTSCIDEGKCFNGTCLDYCAHAGQLTKTPLRPCRCEAIASSCLRCCKSSNGVCKPLNSSSHDSFLQDGRPCSYGYCEAGKCQRTSANMINRLFDFIEHLDSSKFVAFMRTNIVGTVIVFSLVIWIPLSWTITCLDRRSERKAQEQKVTDAALLSQTLQSGGLASHLKDYTIKQSKFRRTFRPEFLQPMDPGGASYHPPPYHTVDKRYQVYDSPVIAETAI